jgi:hypothetical protein
MAVHCVVVTGPPLISKSVYQIKAKQKLENESGGLRRSNAYDHRFWFWSAFPAEIRSLAMIEKKGRKEKKIVHYTDHPFTDDWISCW